VYKKKKKKTARERVLICLETMKGGFCQTGRGKMKHHEVGDGGRKRGWGARSWRPRITVTRRDLGDKPRKSNEKQGPNRGVD